MLVLQTFWILISHLLYVLQILFSSKKIQVFTCLYLRTPKQWVPRTCLNVLWPKPLLSLTCHLIYMAMLFRRDLQIPFLSHWFWRFRNEAGHQETVTLMPGLNRFRFRVYHKFIACQWILGKFLFWTSCTVKSALEEHCVLMPYL